MISVVMVVHNEEKLIERALASVKGIVDEILVIHDGPCADKTLELCKKYGAKTWIRTFEGIAEPHRAWSYAKAKGPWILQLDADEYLSNEMRLQLPELVTHNEVACYAFSWPTWDGKKYITTGWPHKKVLFQKKHILFLGLPHCEVLPQAKVVYSPLVLEHRPAYDNFRFGIFWSKWTKWAKIHADWIRKSPATYTRYPKSNSVLLPRYYIIKRFPLLLALPLGLYQGGLAYFSGGYRMGFTGVKISLMICAYWATVGLYLV